MDGAGRDAGITLIEVLVASAVMMIAMSIFTTGILQIYRTVNKTDSLATSQAQLMAAFARLDREVRYASAISTPVNAAAGDSFVEYVISVPPPSPAPATADAVTTCVQLRLRASTRQLMRRTWESDDTTVAPTPWTLLLAPVSATAAFAVEPGNTTFTSPSLTLDLRVSAGAGTTATTRQSKVTLAALNATVREDDDDDEVCSEGRSIP